jgi:predicted Zn-ribbon and HTH transcriptional regulator
MKQPSYLCSCLICKKSTSSLGIATHFMRIHGSQEQKSLFLNAIVVAKKNAKKIQDEYNIQPNSCQECGIALTYSQRANKYCSSSCSCTANMKIRKTSGWSLPTESRNKTRNKLKTVLGPYTKIRIPSCKFCQELFVTTAKTRICNGCQHLKWNNNKDQYSFKFNVFNYPDIFDLTLIQTHGWVSFGGKRGGSKNIYGLSRDHKVSVCHAKQFGYDAYYISHPLNCELMPHDKNNKKNTNSSITYNELILLVTEYDNRSI